MSILNIEKQSQWKSASQLYLCVTRGPDPNGWITPKLLFKTHTLGLVPRPEVKTQQTFKKNIKKWPSSVYL